MRHLDILVCVCGGAGKCGLQDESRWHIQEGCIPRAAHTFQCLPCPSHRARKSPDGHCALFYCVLHPQLVLLCSLLILAPHPTPITHFSPLPSELCGVPMTTKGRLWSWAAGALLFMSGQRMLHETRPSFQNTQSHWAPTIRVRGKLNTLTIHATRTV